MIRYETLLDAVNIVNGHRPISWSTRLEQQLASSLEIYKGRGEFDGTIKSAKECLERAEYEFAFELPTKD